MRRQDEPRQQRHGLTRLWLACGALRCQRQHSAMKNRYIYALAEFAYDVYWTTDESTERGRSSAHAGGDVSTADEARFRSGAERLIQCAPTDIVCVPVRRSGTVWWPSLHARLSWDIMASCFSCFSHRINEHRSSSSSSNLFLILLVRAVRHSHKHAPIGGHYSTRGPRVHDTIKSQKKVDTVGCR